MSQHRRHSRLRRVLAIAGAASLGAGVLLAGGINAYSSGPLFPDLWQPTFPLAADRWRLSQEQLLLVDQQQHDVDAVLLPDQEVLLLADADLTGDAMAICAFQGGASSPARPLGTLPGSGFHAFICLIPDDPAQKLQAPLLLPVPTSSSPAAPAPAPAPAAQDSPLPVPVRTMLNWSDPIVFESALLDGGDVLVFAKGLNRSQAVSDIHCLYRYRDGDGTSTMLPAITFAQQVVRCPSPPTPPINPANTKVHITLAVTGDKPMPSLATFPTQQADSFTATPPKNSICACTMVRNISKFLREWVLHHSAIGVDQFFLYDNGSEDDLADQVAQLKSAGINISTVAWPWTKTQEAGLSHCAAKHQGSCEWMAFIDVDEFIFSPYWKDLEKPSKSLLETVISVDDNVGQIYLACYDFGPSGQTTHPRDGVCQGYTCRLKIPQRHKSLVRLDAVEPSLMNAVHHFSLKAGYRHIWTALARINHYKFQAWSEFKAKFKRRVSAYVADWKDPINLKSNDRAPGLGVDAIEPAGWAQSFCEVKDNILQQLSTKWFGTGFHNHP